MTKRRNRYEVENRTQVGDCREGIAYRDDDASGLVLWRLSYPTFAEVKGWVAPFFVDVDQFYIALCRGVYMATARRLMKRGELPRADFDAPSKAMRRACVKQLYAIESDALKALETLTAGWDKPSVQGGCELRKALIRSSREWLSYQWVREGDATKRAQIEQAYWSGRGALSEAKGHLSAEELLELVQERMSTAGQIAALARPSKPGPEGMLERAAFVEELHRELVIQMQLERPERQQIRPTQEAFLRLACDASARFSVCVEDAIKSHLTMSAAQQQRLVRCLKTSFGGLNEENVRKAVEAGFKAGGFPHFAAR